MKEDGGLLVEVEVSEWERGARETRVHTLFSFLSLFILYPTALHNGPCHLHFQIIPPSRTLENFAPSLWTL